MCKRVGLSILVCLSLISLLVLPGGTGLLYASERSSAEVSDQFAGGDGTRDNPYQVEAAQQLDLVREHLDKYFVQTADIDLAPYSSGAGWEPIGVWNFDGGHEQKELFTGSYDGRGYSIRNLTINRPDLDSAGLFGAIEEGSMISGLRLVDVSVEGRRRTGAVAGMSFGGFISQCSVEGTVRGEARVGGIVGWTEGAAANCRFEGTVEGRDRYVGGIAGISSARAASNTVLGTVRGNTSVGGLIGSNAGPVSRSSFSGTVEGASHVGGLVGWLMHGTVSLSHAEGTVTGLRQNVGGLVGWARGDISQSYSRAEVSGDSRVGGLIGRAHGEIAHCYAASPLRGSTEVGGLIGFAPEGTEVVFSYFDAELTGLEADNGLGAPRTTQQMMRQETYEQWNFFARWNINEGAGYPELN